MEEELIELRRSRARRKPTKRARCEKRDEILATIAAILMVLLLFILAIVRLCTEPAYAYEMPEPVFTVDDSRPIEDYEPKKAEKKAETVAEEATVNEYREIFDNATDEDYKALEQVILNESVRAFGYNEEGIWECSVATAECVLNRVLSDKFPNTIHEVVYQKGQFYTKKLSGTSIQQEIVCDAIEHIWHEGRTFLPSTDYLYFATTKGVQKRYAKDFIFFGKYKNGKASKGHWYGKGKDV